MPNGGNGANVSRSDLWREIEGDMRALFGDVCQFEIEEYGDYIEVHLKPNEAIEQLESKHDDLRIVPFNSCKMTIRRDE